MEDFWIIVDKLNWQNFISLYVSNCLFTGSNLIIVVEFIIVHNTIWKKDTVADYHGIDTSEKNPMLLVDKSAH